MTQSTDPNDDSAPVWEGGCPYAALAPAGITTSSTLQEIQSSMQYFRRNASGRKREIGPLWDQLRKVESRLVVDFFLYRKEG
jgi:hypothetical protein